MKPTLLVVQVRVSFYNRSVFFALAYEMFKIQDELKARTFQIFQKTEGMKYHPIILF